MNNWEESLFSLKEASFHNLIKNYIVQVSTPFNKQEMIRKLSLWLGHAENAEAVLSRITDEEKTILSVIYFLKNVPWDKLPLEWDDELRENLRERLLIFEDSTCFFIAPALEELFLERGVLDFSRLLDVQSRQSDGEPPFFPDDRLLMGFLSFFSEEKAFFLNDGSPRRRVIEEIQEKLPYPEHREDSFFTEMAELCLQAGLLEKRKNFLILGHKEELDRFEKYSPAERILYLAILNGPSSSRGKLRSLLSRLNTLLPADHVMSSMGWLRLLFFINPRPGHQDIHKWEKLPSRLSLLGLCTFNGDEIGLPADEPQAAGEPQTLLVQPNGDIDLPPGVPFVSSLVMSAHLIKGETFYRFHLTRESFESGLRRGVSNSKLTEDLEKLTGNPLPGNLIMNLKEWENQLHSLRKVSGILLKVSGYPRRLMDQIPLLEDHILERIGEEWILMREETEDKWQSLLDEVGLKPFEEHTLTKSSGMEGFPEEEPFSLPRNNGNAQAPAAGNGKEDKDKLEQKLRSLELPEEQEKELLHRIERDVILLPDQITPDILRNESCKAGGLDFNSKLRLVSAALESECAQLEMKLPGKGGIKTVLAVPLELNNSREESLLLYRNEETGEEESIAVRKILEVIRFHGSLLS